MKNILVTNFQDSGENVLIFAKKLTAQNIETVLKRTQNSFDDVTEISERDRQFYCFDPLWLNEQQEQEVIEHFEL